MPMCGTDIQDVQPQMSKMSPAPFLQDFIPAAARCLFKDSSVYDFDASLKEMMLKCSMATDNVSRKFASVDEYHKIIAKLLHIYILPSIHFTRGDVANLLQVKHHIEERLAKVEENIKAKAIAKENVKKCLDQMMDKFLNEENLDSERYLRTCDRNFLLAVLKVVECNVASLNTDLSAVQNMVNWLKEHPGDGRRLADLQARRDQVFADIDKRIQVRETIKNVAFRRDLSKRKNKKCRVATSCLHNMFTEVLKQLELQDTHMRELGDGKVSICAAREAVLYTLSNITDSDQHSASSSRFEPEKLTSFSFDEDKTDKSDSWLPLEGRVARCLGNRHSVAYICHEHGCQKLISQAVHVFRDLHPAELKSTLIQSSPLATLQVQPCDQHEDLSCDQHEGLSCDQHEDLSCDENLSCQFSLSLSEVTMRQSNLVTNVGQKRNAVYIHKDSQQWRSYFQQANICVESPKMCTPDFSHDAVDATASNNSVVGSALQDCACVDANKAQAVPLSGKAAVRDVISDDYILVVGHRGSSSADVASAETEESPVKLQRSEQRTLTLSVFMDAVEELKGQIQAHLTDVLELLGQETLGSEPYDMSLREQQELLWKSYDRYFCQELHTQLLNLYTTGLTAGVHKAYTELQKLSVLDILKGDKLLLLFFGPSTLRSRASPIPIPRRARDVCARDVCARDVTAVSYSSVCCDLDDFLLSSSGVDLGSSVGTENSGHFGQVCRSAPESVTQSLDEGFDQGSGSFSSSVRSTFSHDSLDDDADDLVGYPINPKKFEDKLSLVLSPFMELVGKCLSAECFNDKIRYITKAIEDLNEDVSHLFGVDFQSTCDDIISMLVLALCSIPQEMFLSLYVNLRLLMDVLPSFFFGSRWDFNLVSLYSAYNYLFSLNISDHIIKTA